MFKTVTRTWNVFKGCRFDCIYCNARKIALTRLKNSPHYQDGFTPRLINEELKRRFRPGEFIFVGYMGDISFATREEVGFILADTIELFPETNFLFCTKNPAVYSTWGFTFPDNLKLGSTIESSVDYGLSKAPSPYDRYIEMVALHHPHKFLSIEPILDFDMKMMVRIVRNMRPEIVEIGYDNYSHHLIEPELDKTLALIKTLEGFTIVKKKTIRKAWNE
jgi:hypothetical protein